MFGQNGGGVVHTAPEYIIRIFGFNGGEDGFEVGGFVGGRIAVHHAGAALLQGFGHFVGNAFAVLGGVIQHRYGFAAVFQHVLRQHRCLARVGEDGAVGANQAAVGFHAFEGVVGIGGGGGDLYHACFGIHFVGGNGNAGIKMPHHAHHGAVHQFLRHHRALFGVGGIVFAHHRQFHFFTANHEIALGVDVVDGQLHAALSVQTRFGNAAS